MATIKIKRAQPVPLNRGPGIIAQSQAVLREGMAKANATLEVGGTIASGLNTFGEQVRITEAAIKSQNIEANYAVDTAEFLNSVNTGVDKDGTPNKYYGLSPEDLKSATEEGQAEINDKYSEAITTVPDRATRGRLDANFIIARKELELETQGVVNQKRVTQLQLEDQTLFANELSDKNWEKAREVTANALNLGLIDNNAYKARNDLTNAEERNDYYIGSLGNVAPETGAFVVTDEQAEKRLLETFNDPKLTGDEGENVRASILKALEERNSIAEKNYIDAQNRNETALYVNKASREETVQLLIDDQITDDAARAYIKILDSDPDAINSPSELNEIYRRMSLVRSGDLTEAEVSEHIAKAAQAKTISQKTALALAQEVSGLRDKDFGGTVYTSIRRQGLQTILGVPNPDAFDIFDNSAKTSALKQLSNEFTGEMMEQQLDNPYFDPATWWKEAKPRYEALVEEIKIGIPDFPPELEEYRQTQLDSRGAVVDDNKATAAVLREEYAARNIKRKDVETAYKAMGLGDFTE